MDVLSGVVDEATRFLECRKDSKFLLSRTWRELLLLMQLLLGKLLLLEKLLLLLRKLLGKLLLLRELLLR